MTVGQTVLWVRVAAVSSKLLSLTKHGKLPKHLWASVAESTLPGAEGENNDDEEEEEEEE